MKLFSLSFPHCFQDLAQCSTYFLADAVIRLGIFVDIILQLLKVFLCLCILY